jgi:hypothetical protein
MTVVRPTEDLLQVAKRVVWFQTPQETLRDPVLFLCHVMTYAMIEDLKVVRSSFSDDDFKEALRQAHPGIFDARSWAYWLLILGEQPAPPLPTRQFPDGSIR